MNKKIYKLYNPIFILIYNIYINNYSILNEVLFSSSDSSELSV